MSPFHLAWANLAHKRGRTTIAAGGVAFAVILIFMELGMLGGVRRTATMLFDKLNFDLFITSAEYLDMSRAGEFERERLAQAHAAKGVADVIPISIGAGGWRLPSHKGIFGTTPGGAIMSINTIALPPALLDRAFIIGPGGAFATVEEARAAGVAISQLDSYLFDRRSKADFGNVNQLIAASRMPESADPIRLNGMRATIVGTFTLGTGFSWNGMLISSEETMYRFTGRSPRGVDFGLVQLEPGADPETVKRELQSILPRDVKVYTRDEINASESRYWLRLTSVGQFLIVAVVLAIVVGVIFVYQMMAADIRNMMPEYATVKALGYRPPYLTAVVMWQAALLAVLGYLPGFFASLGFYAIAREYGGIPAGMTLAIAAAVVVLTLGMCLASGMLAVRKVHTAEPADLF
ncbi:MAG TPA: FtsX-like permease family protein [Gemmata sp.]|nr:FtsX-like permease family protein [Gemmata sp.]